MKEGLRTLNGQVKLITVFETQPETNGTFYGVNLLYWYATKFGRLFY